MKRLLTVSFSFASRETVPRTTTLRAAHAAHDSLSSSSMPTERDDALAACCRRLHLAHPPEWADAAINVAYAQADVDIAARARAAAAAAAVADGDVDDTASAPAATMARAPAVDRMRAALNRTKMTVLVSAKVGGWRWGGGRRRGDAGARCVVSRPRLARRGCHVVATVPARCVCVVLRGAHEPLWLRPRRRRGARAPARTASRGGGCAWVLPLDDAQVNNTLGGAVPRRKLRFVAALDEADAPELAGQQRIEACRERALRLAVT